MKQRTKQNLNTKHKNTIEAAAVFCGTSGLDRSHLLNSQLGTLIPCLRPFVFRRYGLSEVMLIGNVGTYG